MKARSCFSNCFWLRGDSRSCCTRAVWGLDQDVVQPTDVLVLRPNALKVNMLITKNLRRKPSAAGAPLRNKYRSDPIRSLSLLASFAEWIATLSRGSGFTSPSPTFLLRQIHTSVNKNAEGTWVEQNLLRKLHNISPSKLPY